MEIHTEMVAGKATLVSSFFIHTDGVSRQAWLVHVIYVDEYPSTTFDVHHANCRVCMYARTMDVISAPDLSDV